MKYITEEFSSIFQQIITWNLNTAWIWSEYERNIQVSASFWSWIWGRRTGWTGSVIYRSIKKKISWRFLRRLFYSGSRNIEVIVDTGYTVMHFSSMPIWAGYQSGTNQTLLWMQLTLIQTCLPHGKADNIHCSIIAYLPRAG